jgi:hypothetical protein
MNLLINFPSLDFFICNMRIGLWLSLGVAGRIKQSNACKIPGLYEN